VLAGHFSDLGKNLNKAVETYNRAVGSLERNVLTSARRMKELGAGNELQIVGLEPIEKSSRPMQAPEMQIVLEAIDGVSLDGELYQK